MSRAALQGWADAVTVSRVALLPVLILAAESVRGAADGGEAANESRLLVLVVLLAIGGSDILDGWLARRSGAPPTQRGAMLDVAADRLVQWTGVWYFAFRGVPAFTPLPLWLPGTLVLRDALLLAIWLRHRRAKTTSFEHELHGKAATVTIFLALLATVAGASSALVILSALAAGVAVLYSTVRYAVRLAAQPA